jgi:hypothetical protein
VRQLENDKKEFRETEYALPRVFAIAAPDNPDAAVRLVLEQAEAMAMHPA